LDPTHIPAGWKPYHGSVFRYVFHCGFSVIEQACHPDTEHLQQECSYRCGSDGVWRLVTEEDEYCGCRGSANAYDSAFAHIFYSDEPGGVRNMGWEGWVESYRYNFPTTAVPADPLYDVRLPWGFTQ
jgi:hypothetical protein